MELDITQITPLYPDKMFIQWDIKEVNESGIFLFDVFRSGSKEGPWDQIAAGLNNQYAFVDDFTAPFALTTETHIRPNTLNMFREFVYRVVATTPSGKKLEAIDDQDPKFEGSLPDLKMNQYWRKSVRDFRLTLKFNGTRCIVLKRRHWGERCECVDKKIKEVMRSSCKKCWGTGIVDGYWAPILTYTRRAVSANASTVTPQGKSDSNDTKLWMPDYPGIESEDVLIYLKDNTRWRLDQGTQTQIRLQDIHQVISAQVIDKSHIIYRLKIDVTQLNPLF